MNTQKQMHEPTLQDFTKNIFETACKIRSEKKEEVLPIVFVKPVGDKAIMGVPFMPIDQNHKPEFMADLGKMLATNGVQIDFVVLVTEAYMKMFDKNHRQEAENYRQGQLKEDPEASEIIMVQGRTRDNKHIMYSKDLKSGKVSHNEGTSTGILDYIFNPSMDNES